MSLTEEEYHTLYEAVAATPHEGSHFELVRRKYDLKGILSQYATGGLGELLLIQHVDLQYLTDMAAIIILKEGRELP